MLTYTMNGKMIHITGDKQATICGKNCTDWGVERENVDWNGHKRDCPTCGNKSDFDYERAKIVHELEERSKAEAAAEVERKAQQVKWLAALDTLSTKWKDFIVAECPEATVKSYWGATVFNATVAQDGFKFQIELKVK